MRGAGARDADSGFLASAADAPALIHVLPTDVISEFHRGLELRVLKLPVAHQPFRFSRVPASTSCHHSQHRRIDDREARPPGTRDGTRVDERTQGADDDFTRRSELSCQLLL